MSPHLGRFAPRFLVHGLQRLWRRQLAKERPELGKSVRRHRGHLHHRDQPAPRPARRAWKIRKNVRIEQDPNTHKIRKGKRKTRLL